MSRRSQLKIALASLVLAGVSASGCARTVLVPEGSPMRVGPRASMRVYALVDGNWQLSDNKIVVPEGWYLVPPSYVKDEDPLP
jgi:hypothetical protein